MLPLIASLLLATPPSTKDIERAVQTALDQWRVPGLALVIVHDDRVIFLKGFGKTSLDGDKPVTPDTTFPLASCTKPFTTALLAHLVQNDTLKWDDPLRKHLPDFRLHDPVASERTTLRDVLCHRTGMAGHDLLWYGTNWPLDERLRRLGLIEPNADFRTLFQYQTVLFGAAGLAAERATRQSWSDLMTERLLKPLGMKSTFPTDPGQNGDVAFPHRANRADKILVCPRYPLNRPDPAGSMHSSARDLAAFLRFQLADNDENEKPLVAAWALHETHTPQMLIRMESFAKVMNPETVQISYGLGWIVQDYRGQRILLHGGAIDGFRSQLTLVPKARLALGVLSNLDDSYCNFALTNRLIDLFLGSAPRDWNEYYLAIEKKDRDVDRQRALALREKRPQDAKPTLPLADYVGDFEDPAYGVCRIREGKKGLTMDFGNFQTPLEHHESDTFFLDQAPFRDAPAFFVKDANNRVVSLRVMSRVFVRQSDKKSVK